MTIQVTREGWVNVYDDRMKPLSRHVFPRIEQAIAGDDFIVVQLKGGWVEVYDCNFTLLSSDVFLNIDWIKADNDIMVNYRNGWCESYDKLFNFKSLRYCG